MALAPGTHVLGPDDATLTIRTGRTGAASKAGHDLVIRVETWDATLDVGAEPRETSIVLRADAGSLRVLEGTGGISALGDDDKVGIVKTIDKEVLKRVAIVFRSTSVTPGADGALHVEGDLDLGGAHAIKPYSALFGTLKVADDVQVVIDAPLPSGA